MPKRTDIHSVLIIGAGPIIIGSAAERGTWSSFRLALGEISSGRITHCVDQEREISQ